MPTSKSKDTPKRTTYDPKAIEAKWYEYWENHSLFKTSVNASKEPHVIVMPPPNVTGRLHMGHALQDTIQDSLTRMRRMQGFEALWLPGMDHAGIATQNVVEKALVEEEGKDRHAYGREAFVKRVWKWKEEYGDIILKQKRRLGDSCDWSKERFTMDEGFSRAVQHVFVKLYEEGLVYRGEYLINWCPVDQTALSDEEVDNVERDGYLWYIRYPLVSGDGHITIATTRPETMLGDTAIAVHPDDKRYTDLVGQSVRLPLTDREIPVIADEYVKQDFGAGALKITPGHDRNDFEIGQKHGLPVLNIIDVDGSINESGFAYAGMDRFDARKKIVEDLEAQGLLEKIEPYVSMVPISSRSKATIEPLISRQWFVKMKPLAEPAIEAVRSGAIKFHPKRWENEYFRWLENIRDWTISRQLWWGHRIPVWYYTDSEGEIDESREFVVSVDQPEKGMVQDEDVLDTWFSSWLWPFATLGWPEDNEDVKYFYPGSVLVSGYDILFFWIARMIMAGLHFMGEVPFTDIFITGMIKDKLGRWMQKSLGNGIDPLDMIDQYGADAVRFCLTILCAQGQDIKLDPSKFEMGRNFANKIWNAFNVFGQFMEEGKEYRRQRRFEDLDLAEKWMLTRLNQTISEIDEDVRKYRLNEALTKIYTLFWGDYCDWYLELIKPKQGGKMEEDQIALAADLFGRLLQLLHPFMPFITEELWWKLRHREETESCMTSQWPTSIEEEISVDDARVFSVIQEMISAIRNIKSQYNVPPGNEIAATLSIDKSDKALATALAAHGDYFAKLAKTTRLSVESEVTRPDASASAVVGKNQVFVPLSGMIDLEVERTRLRKEIDQKEKYRTGLERKLQNELFVSRAPADVVEKEKLKMKDTADELERLHASLSELG